VKHEQAGRLARGRPLAEEEVVHTRHHGGL
jgi:hypothetical protein